jgi:hypothetical protein
MGRDKRATRTIIRRVPVRESGSSLDRRSIWVFLSRAGMFSCSDVLSFSCSHLSHLPFGHLPPPSASSPNSVGPSPGSPWFYSDPSFLFYSTVAPHLLVTPS